MPFLNAIVSIVSFFIQYSAKIVVINSFTQMCFLDLLNASYNIKKFIVYEVYACYGKIYVVVDFNKMAHPFY